MKKLQNKVSVIVATYNCKGEIEKTIKSFVDQTYRNKELIIIDGDSTDGTVEIIKKYEKYIANWVSKPDKGISDAFNKGVKASKGDYLYFIGAGDCFWSEDALERMMDGVKDETLVCGRINRVSEDGNNILYTSSLDFEKWHLLYKMGLPHQALFTHKKFFDEYGLFDLNCKYAMDYELLLRAYKNFPNVVLKDVIVAAWREGGIGKDRTEEVLEEYRKIKIKNNIAPFCLIELISWVSRLWVKIK